MESAQSPDTPKIQWRTKYAVAYYDGPKMVIRYRFPYSKIREAQLLGAYNLSPKDRLPYYRTLSAMVERNIVVSNYLKSQGISSILFFEKTYQQQEDNGIIGMYCVPEEPITPITHSLFSTDCNALQALDVFLRLTHILRDIHQTPDSLSLRYLDLEDVYLTEDNKIKLGGFFYASAEGLDVPPPYLQDAAPVMPDTLNAGAAGDIGADMQILCQIAWNIFSGLPWDTSHTAISKKIPPRYAPPQLLAVLELGLNGNADDFSVFRKLLLSCRKELAKTPFAQQHIPMKAPYRKEYHYIENSNKAP